MKAVKEKKTNGAAERARSARAGDTGMRLDLVVLDPRASFAGAVKSRVDRPWPTARQTRPFGYDNQFDLISLRHRAIHLDRTNVLARSVIDRCVDNVIGEGIQIQAATNDESWNQDAESLWNDWAEGACDARRLDQWNGLQRLYARHYVRDGDACFVLRSDGSLQLPEPRIMQTPPSMSGQLSIVDGVEFDTVGRPVGFHFQGAKPSEYVRVEARDVVYARRSTEAGLTRGIAAFATTARDLDQIDGLIEAVICAAEMAAMLALLITTTDQARELGQLRTQVSTASGSKKEFAFEPGMIKYLNPGESVSPVVPAHPSQNLNEFLATMFRRIGLEFGLPLELVTLDFSRTNYSSARAALLQSQKRFRTIQSEMAAVVKRVYRWRVSKWIKEGVLGARPDAWLCRVIPPSWPWVDPVKEAQANLLGLDGGWTTLAEICASQGRDFVDVLRARQREIAELDSAGIPQVHSNMSRDRLSPAGQTPIPSGEDEEEDPEEEDDET